MNNTILVIEDNEEMRNNLADILQLAQYQVLQAPNGRVGVELAQVHQPDLILCDIMMPELDGYGVLHILGKDPDTAGIPFIFLTAKTERSDVRTGMDLGADDYITKPFDGSELLKVIEVRLRRHEQLKNSFDGRIEDIDDFFTRARQLKDFQKLSENRQVRKVRKKDFVFMEGLEPNDLFLIQKGVIKTYKTTQDGKELVTGIHKKGEFIGFVPLIENKPYNESAMALEEAEVYLIPKDDFLALIYSNQIVSRNFIKLLSNDLFETEQRLMEMAYQSVRQRVASSLLKICDQVCVPEKGNYISMARKDISGMVGTATESLNRTLADFKDEGLVEISDGGIRLINKSKLERIAH
jgi:DNA-binding response OmpR family regulator